MPVWLEPAAPQSRVKHSTTEPLHSIQKAIKKGADQSVVRKPPKTGFLKSRPELYCLQNDSICKLQHQLFTIKLSVLYMISIFLNAKSVSIPYNFKPNKSPLGV